MLNWAAITPGADPINDPTFNPEMISSYMEHYDEVGFEVQCAAFALSLMRNVGLYSPDGDSPVMAIDHIMNIGVKHTLKKAREEGHDAEWAAKRISDDTRAIIYGLFIIAFEAYDDYSIFRRGAVEHAHHDWTMEQVNDVVQDPDNGMCCAFHVAEKMLVELDMNTDMKLRVQTERYDADDGTWLDADDD